MNNLLYNFVRVIAFFVININFLKPKVYNKKNTYVKEKCIVICNHTSNWDPIILGYYIHPHNLHYLAKVELVEKPAAQKFLLAMGIIPVARGKSDLKAIKNAMKALKNGEALGIFPEGTRSHTGDLLPFEQGVSVIALKTKTPVLPVYIHAHGYKPFHRIKVNVGEKIDLCEKVGDKSNVEAINHATDLLFSTMKNLREEMINEER